MTYISNYIFTEMGISFANVTKNSWVYQFQTQQVQRPKQCLNTASVCRLFSLTEESFSWIENMVML